MAPKRKQTPSSPEHEAKRLQPERQSGVTIDHDHSNSIAANRDSDFTTLSLLKLPEELIKSIAEVIPLDDLLQFSHACRKTRNIAFPIFAKQFFQNRAFLLSDRRSMTRLLCISQQSDLAKYFRQLILSPLLFSRKNRKRRYVMGGVSRHAWGLNRIPKNKLNSAWTDIQWKWPEKTIDDEPEPDEHNVLGSDLFGVLVAIFTNLGHWETRPCIIFQDLVSCKPTPSGLEKFRPFERPVRGAFGYTDEVSTCLKCLYQIPIYKAIVESGYRTHELQLGHLDNEIPLVCFSYGPMRFPAEQLRTLHIELSPLPAHRIDQVSSYEHRRNDLEDFVTVLAKAEGLQFFHLSQRGAKIFEQYRYERWGGYSDVFHALTTKYDLEGEPLDVPDSGPLLPRLETLELHSHNIKLSVLERFCRERRKTLKTVRLEQVTDFVHYEPGVVHERLEKVIRKAEGDQVVVQMAHDCYDGEKSEDGAESEDRTDSRDGWWGTDSGSE